LNKINNKKKNRGQISRKKKLKSYFKKIERAGMEIKGERGKK